jgi:citrate synthase
MTDKLQPLTPATLTLENKFYSLPSHVGVEGEKDTLHYRGYPIEELAKNSRFAEATYLLFHGE